MGGTGTAEVRLGLADPGATVSSLFGTREAELMFGKPCAPPPPQVSGSRRVCQRPQFPSGSRVGRGWAGRPRQPGAFVPLADPPAGALLHARLSMTPEEHRAFWRNVQFTVDKDVVRTDRSNQFFRGEGNPNVESMRYHIPGQHVSSPLRFTPTCHLTPQASVDPLGSGKAAASAGVRGLSSRFNAPESEGC